uniref:Uncharacterized protein n=1 Tax=Magallana gigas TaxID=29159 RepID=A0A8W8NZ57_MAGGI
MENPSMPLIEFRGRVLLWVDDRQPNSSKSAASINKVSIEETTPETQSNDILEVIKKQELLEKQQKQIDFLTQMVPRQQFHYRGRGIHSDREVDVDLGGCVLHDVGFLVSKVNDEETTDGILGCNILKQVHNLIKDDPQCTTIGNGCFLAEPSCKGLTSTSYPQEATEQINPGNKEWILFGTTCGLFITTCLAFVCFRFINLRKGEIVGYVIFSIIKGSP